MTPRSKRFAPLSLFWDYSLSPFLKRQKLFAPFVFAAFSLALAGCVQIDQSRPAQFSDLTIFFQNVIRNLAPVAAIAFLIMVFVAGFQFLTSGGDQKAVAGARTTLTYAIIGIILVVVSWLILLLIQQITGVDTTTVTIPESQ